MIPWMAASAHLDGEESDVNGSVNLAPMVSRAI